MWGWQQVERMVRVVVVATSREKGARGCGWQQVERIVRGVATSREKGARWWQQIEWCAGGNK